MTTKAQEFTTSGTFTVPAGVTLIKSTQMGTGGTGSSGFAIFGAPSCGGGAGSFCSRIPLHVTPGEVLTITIGATGTPSDRTHFPSPFVMNPTTVRTLSVDGGKSAYWDDSGHLKSGGGGYPATRNNFTPNDLGGGGAWAPHDATYFPVNMASVLGAPGFFPGSCGGSDNAPGVAGGDAAGHPGGAGAAGGAWSGGASSPFGAGGAAGTTNSTNGQAGQGYGAGGGGAGNFAIGGRGATGYVMLEWTAP